METKHSTPRHRIAVAIAACYLLAPGSAAADVSDPQAAPLNAWDNQYGKGEGEQYMAFIVEVLKPWVDQHYRTKSDRRHTGVTGSSMGGLISSYAISHYGHVY